MSLDGPLRVSRGLLIPASELDWGYSTSGGPGGQHANRALTRVELRFDIEASRALGPRQRDRLRERFGATVVVSAADSRSQARNREAAADRLRTKLADALSSPRSRRATAPSASARRRRVSAKRRRGEVKRLRRRPGEGD